MPNFQKLLDWRFWFSLRPAVLGGRAVWFLLIVFAAILAGALVFRILIFLKKKNPPLAGVFRKLYKLFLAMGLFGFVLLFLSYERIYLLGSHFWFLLWLVGFLVWLGFVARYLLVQLPKEKAELEKKKRFLKYLPH